MPSICRNIVLLSHILQAQTYNLFYLDLLYLDNEPFLAILFDLFLCPIFFLGTYFVWLFRLFQDLLEYFLKKYGFSILFFLIFAVKFSFLNTIESVSVLKICPASARILFFLSLFLEVRTYNLYYYYIFLKIYFF